MKGHSLGSGHFEAIPLAPGSLFDRRVDDRGCGGGLGLAALRNSIPAKAAASVTWNIHEWSTQGRSGEANVNGSTVGMFRCSKMNWPLGRCHQKSASESCWQPSRNAVATMRRSNARSATNSTCRLGFSLTPRSSTAHFRHVS